MNTQKIAPVVLTLALLGNIGCGGGGGGSSDGGTVSGADACSEIGLAKVANATQCTVGADPTASPLVRLRIFGLDGSEGVCSGAVVDSNVVLTAAHCFEEAVVAVQVDTFVGSFSGNFQNSPLFNTTPSPFFENGEIFENDVAVVFTDGEINTTKAKLLVSRAPQIGEEAVVAGFGDFNPGVSDGDIRAGLAIVQNVTPQHVFISFEENQSHPCQGDSGGPIFVDVNGELAIAGVVSQSDPQVDPNTVCRPGDVTLYTNLQSSESMNFLNSVAPGIGTL